MVASADQGWRAGRARALPPPTNQHARDEARRAKPEASARAAADVKRRHGELAHRVGTYGRIRQESAGRTGRHRGPAAAADHQRRRRVAGGVGQVS